MNNEQKHKTSSSIVSIACSTLNTQITTTTSTKTTPTSTAPQTSVHHRSLPQAAVPTSSSTLSKSSTSSLPLLAAAANPSIQGQSSYPSDKSGVHISTNVTPMTDDGATCQQRGDPDDASASSKNFAVTLKKGVPVNTIADTATSTPPALVAVNSTPKIAATTEETNNSICHTNAEKKKTETWEECRLKDWDDSRLKNLLEEAYSYKNPRDKENKSETFLQLLQNAENEKEDQTFAFRAIASRYTRNSTTSTSSASQKQGGSLQDLVEAVRNESLLDCDYNFTVGGQRNRRHNHNSRQKKYSSVSSRQREGGSLPSNVNVTYSGVGVAGGVINNLINNSNDQQNISSAICMHETTSVIKNKGNNIGIVNNTNINICNSNISSNINNINIINSTGNSASNKNQRRKLSERSTTAATIAVEDCDNVIVVGFNDNNNNNSNNNSNNSELTREFSAAITGVSGGGGAVGDGIGVQNEIDASNGASNRHCVIEMGEPMLDIQQQQQILATRGQDAATQGLPYYDRLDNMDMPRIPRSNIISSMQAKTDFTPSSTSPQAYVDEAVRFTTLERGGGSTSGSSGAPTATTATTPTACAPNKVASSTIDAKYLPLDENYKSCKSILGEKSELAKTTSFPTSKAITRHLDENGNSFNEIYQKGAAAAAALLNATSVSGGGASGAAGGNSSIVNQSQAKGKNKKKSQQERNTKTVDVKSVAGYRGNDPVDELVKYIESTEDKQNENNRSNNSNRFNENSKKKERKKEKQHKMKKSNSLEELRTCSKIEVDEFKAAAATTESNSILRNKSGKSKNNSASAADINKNYENKDTSGEAVIPLGPSTTEATTTSATATTTVTLTVTITNDNSNQRKGERHSWGGSEEHGTEYLADGNDHEEKLLVVNKEKRNTKNKDNEKDEKLKDFSIEKVVDKQDKNVVDQHNDRNTIIPTTTTALKSEKRKKIENNSQTTTTTIDATSIVVSNAVPTNILNNEDVSLMDASLLSEFHVVTKKRKAKKQRPSLDETSTAGGIGGFNRSSNIMSGAQRSSASISRHKYYNQHGAYSDYNNQVSNSSGNYNNYNSSNNNNNSSANTYSSHNNNNNFNNNNSNYNNSSKNYNNNNNSNINSSNHSNSNNIQSLSLDKSRRKSTSSMPPSEKSDSSDIDSVHSLPIASTSGAATVTVTNAKQRQRKVTTTATTAAGATISNKSSGATAVLNVSSTSAPPLISYADIARNNKEQQQHQQLTFSSATPASTSNNVEHKLSTVDSVSRSASASLSISAVNSIDSSPVDATSREIIVTATAAVETIDPQIMVTATTSGSLPTKHKAKKSVSKTDFPELIATLSPSAAAAVASAATAVPMTAATTATVAVNQTETKASTILANFKSVSYSQSLTTSAPSGALRTNELSFTGDVSLPKENSVMTTSASFEMKKSIYPPQVSAIMQSQQQTLQKSKSVDNESPNYNYSYNSSNMDQQYPALEKTVKRHSTSMLTTNSIGLGNALVTYKLQQHNNNTTDNNISYTSANAATATAPAVPVTSINNKNSNTAISNVITLPALTAITTIALTPLTAPNMKKIKEKTNATAVTATAMLQPMHEPLSLMNSTSSSGVANSNLRKIRKDKQQQHVAQLHQQQQLPKSQSGVVPLLHKSATTATQTGAASTYAINTDHSANTNNNVVCRTNLFISNKKFDNSLAHRYSVKSSALNKHGNIRSCNNNNNSAIINTTMNHSNVTGATSRISNSLSGTTIGATTANRPAVIILNDDRSMSCHYGRPNTEFTFGDFNEEELKFFDDDISADLTNPVDFDDGDVDDDDDEYEIYVEDNDILNSENNNNDMDNNMNISEHDMAKRTQSDVLETQSVIGLNQKRKPLTNSTSDKNLNNSQQKICLNDSGTNFNITSVSSSSSSTSDIGGALNNSSTQQNDDLVIMASTDASSSPNSSLIVSANQSADSGFYTNNKLVVSTKISGSKTKRPSTCTTSDVAIHNSSACGVDSCLDVSETKSKLNASLSSSPPSLSERISTNTSGHIINSQPFSTTNTKRTVPSSHQPIVKQSNVIGERERNETVVTTTPLPQQLETCDDIETAIIAQAKEAAKQHQQSSYRHPQQICNLSSSASSSLSSSSSVSTESTKYSSTHQTHRQQNIQQYQYQQHRNHHKYHNQHQQHHYRNYSQQTEEDEAQWLPDAQLRFQQQHQQQYHRTDRSRSNSSSWREDIAVAVDNCATSAAAALQHKDKDLYFKPPTNMPSAMSSLQHNDIIIDFIGSAWEEVANSKVTKFYDGQ